VPREIVHGQVAIGRLERAELLGVQHGSEIYPRGGLMETILKSPLPRAGLRPVRPAKQ
jgi:hypothetical protein